MARQPKNFIKISLVLLFLFWFFSPTIIFALDQRCWEKDKCKASDVGGAFYGPNAETIKACGSIKNAAEKELGFCKPPYVANTEVDFGGRTSFENIGVFIKYMFRYSVMAAGILSVIMIMFAGFEWITSGGNSEKISGAKKKISGAIMGLLIASLSYALLSNINPYLVNLRLPQAWMINTQGLAPVYCDVLTPPSTKVAWLDPQGQTVSEADKIKKEKETDYDKNGVLGSEASCGNRYLVANTGAQTCWGMNCHGTDNSPKICVNYLNIDKNKPFSCVSAMLAGQIGAPPVLFCSDLSGSVLGNLVDNNLLLIAMCKDGDLQKVDDMNLPDNARSYMFSTKSNIESICGEVDNLAGFYIAGEVNDEGGGLLGGFCAGLGGIASSGCDDWHAIGKNGQHECSLNLGKLGTTILKGVPPTCDNQIENAKPCSCAAISDEPNVKKLTQDTSFTSHLITLEELKKGYVCNITISRQEFPALNNSSISGLECAADDDTDCWDDQNSL